MRAYITFWATISAIGILVGLHLSGALPTKAYLAIIAIASLALHIWRNTKTKQ